LPPSRELYRIGYKPNVWALPDWKYISSTDGTFPNRYDDPNGEYRVLYAASQRLTCFLEVLAPFRVAPEIASGLAEIDSSEGYPVGTVPQAMFEPLQIGRASLELPDSLYADICSSEWIGRLRPILLPYFSGFGIKVFDASTLLATSPRRLTQLVSRFVYESGFRGIRYPSKHGLDLENWAFLDCVPVSNAGVEAIRMDDPDLQRALELHALRLGD
jgi:RES domain